MDYVKSWLACDISWNLISSASELILTHCNIQNVKYVME